MSKQTPQQPDQLEETERRNLKNDRFIPDLKCPACGWKSVFVASGNYLTCSRFDCPNPDYTDALTKSMISRKEVEAALTGREIDVEATRKHMESKGATKNEILNMEIEADDLLGVLNDIRSALGMEK